MKVDDWVTARDFAGRTHRLQGLGAGCDASSDKWAEFAIEWSEMPLKCRNIFAKLSVAASQFIVAFTEGGGRAHRKTAF